MQKRLAPTPVSKDLIKRGGTVLVELLQSKLDPTPPPKKKKKKKPRRAKGARQRTDFGENHNFVPQSIVRFSLIHMCRRNILIDVDDLKLL